MCASNATQIMLFVDVWSVALDSSFAMIAQSWSMKRETTFTFSRHTRFLNVFYIVLVILAKFYYIYIYIKI